MYFVVVNGVCVCEQRKIIKNWGKIKSEIKKKNQYEEKRGKSTRMEKLKQSNYTIKNHTFHKFFLLLV